MDDKIDKTKQEENMYFLWEELLEIMSYWLDYNKC